MHTHKYRQTPEAVVVVAAADVDDVGKCDRYFNAKMGVDRLFDRLNLRWRRIVHICNDGTNKYMYVHW